MFAELLFSLYTALCLSAPVASNMSIRQLTLGVQPTASVDLAPVAGDDGLPLCYSASTKQYTPALPVQGTGGNQDFAAKWVISGGGAPLMAADTNFKVTTMKLSGGEQLVFATWDSQVSANASIAGLTDLQVTLPDSIMPLVSLDGAGSISLTNDPDAGAARVVCSITTIAGASGAGRLKLTPSVAHTCTADPIVVPAGVAIWISKPI